MLMLYMLDRSLPGLKTTSRIIGKLQVEREKLTTGYNNKNRRAIGLPSRGDLRPSHDGKKVKLHGKFSLRPQRPGRSAAPQFADVFFPPGQLPSALLIRSLLIRAGDVEYNPGPSDRVRCKPCGRNIRVNQVHLTCTGCGAASHKQESCSGVKSAAFASSSWRCCVGHHGASTEHLLITSYWWVKLSVPKIIRAGSFNEKMLGVYQSGQSYYTTANLRRVSKRLPQKLL